MTDVFVEVRERRGVVDPVKGTVSSLAGSQRQWSLEEAKILFPCMLLRFIPIGNCRQKRLRFADTLQVLEFGRQIAQLHMTLMLLIQRILCKRKCNKSTSLESGIDAAAIILTQSC